MVTALQRLATLCVRRRWLVLVAWLLVLGAAGGSAVAFGGRTDDSFSVPGTESEQALQLLDHRFPGTGGTTARIVFAAPEGHDLGEQRYARLVAATVAQARDVPQTIPGAAREFRSSLQVSPDRRVAFADLQLDVPVSEIDTGTKQALEEVAGPARAAGLDVEYSGGVISTSEPGGEADLIGIGVAYLVLLVTFGALLVAGLPLLSALLGIGVASLTITALSGGLTISSSAPTLSLMLGLAVGIDYASFIISRARQARREGAEVDAAIIQGTAAAGGSVVFAGVTVILALLALSVVGIPFLRTMGLAAAGSVAVAVVVAVTFLPALMAVTGDRWARQRRTPREPALGRRYVGAVTRRPWIALGLALVVVVLGVVNVPGTRQGLPSDSSAPTDTTQRRAYDLLAEGFGEGANGPLQLVIDTRGTAIDASRAGTDALGLLRGDRDVLDVAGPLVNQAGDLAIVVVTPRSGPSSPATADLAHRIRTTAADLGDRRDVDTYVTGQTAVDLDTASTVAGAMPLFVGLILVLALLLLILVFRSLLVPLVAVLGFAASLFTALGVTRFVFQDGHGLSLLGAQGDGQVVSFVPVLTVAVLFGLAMDYEVFLVSRMKELHDHGADPHEATVSGFASSARVVTAAAIIMIAVFVAFVLDPSIVIKQIAFALAVGIAVDAFVIRMTVIPAIHQLLGARAWALPRLLDRLLPRIDLEGSSLS
ncbi:MMPL family transporter [Nocardioides plantarum]|uniref:MMPL family transporter n=1 Tax=Nocardioides plantarum TaxID=29299 RepID=A0ABV5KI49_9ACTN|nr:MMPL family transporter [Nocardioides plantarum]